MAQHHRRQGIFWLLAILIGALPLSAAHAQAGLRAQPATIIARREAGWDARTLVKPQARGMISVIVKLDDAPLAAYSGTIAGLAATAPAQTGARRLDATSAASRNYLAYLDRQQNAFVARAQAAIPQARLAARYRVVLGGVAMIIPAGKIAQLAALPGVRWVQPDALRQADTDRSPQFIGADVIWRALAADPKLGDGGEGVIVGVIDTGIWPEHPSFADDGSYPPPPARWHGACEPPNDKSSRIFCTRKLIGARQRLDLYKFFFGLNPTEFDSARDNEGHGTHTASTAAGNAGVAATVLGQPRGVVSGIAPRASIAAYKALGNSGGLTSDLVSAIDQAVADGVDIINYSIGSTILTDPYQSPDSLAFLDAYRAGVFVAASAGNNGPAASTLDSPANSPWVMTVAASTTDERFVGTLTVRAGGQTLTLSGASITGGVLNRPLVNAAALGVPLCDGPLPAAARGAIVLCRRGVIARVEKGSNVRISGGAGMILYNPEPADVVSDNHWLPAVHIDTPVANQLLAFLAAHTSQPVTADIIGGKAVLDSQTADQIAAFSSRGPLPTEQLGISKPDIAAPGVQILAGQTPLPNTPGAGPQGQFFQAIAGTSMAAPHVAGAGALLKALHPDWTPGQIKSALMTTARTGVLKEDGRTLATPYDTGAGRLDLRNAGDPGLTIDAPASAFTSQAAHLYQVNYPSISLPIMPGRQSVTRTVRSVLDQPAVWSLSTSAPPGARIRVEPATLALAARGTATFTVTVDAISQAPGAYHGSVVLRSGGRTLHMPVSWVRATPNVALAQQCAPSAFAAGSDTSCTISATNNSTSNANIQLQSAIPAGLTLRTETLSGASYDPGTRQLRYSSILPAYRPASFTIAPAPGGLPFGYLPLATLGVKPSPCGNVCDEVALTYKTAQFSFNGASYTSVTMVSNGYLILGDKAVISPDNEEFPSTTTPNNVIAPYWTDLDLRGTLANDPGGGTWSAANVTSTNGSTTWFVAEWNNVPRFGRDPAVSHHSFQIWIELGSDRIHMAYGPNTAAEDRLTVGGENSDGTIGTTYYVDTVEGDGARGTGTLPGAGSILSITPAAAQRSPHTITFLLRGDTPGSYRLNTELRASIFDGTNIATQLLTVRAP